MGSWSEQVGTGRSRSEKDSRGVGSPRRPRQEVLGTCGKVGVGNWSEQDRRRMESWCGVLVWGAGRSGVVGIGNVMEENLRQPPVARSWPGAVSDPEPRRYANRHILEKRIFQTIYKMLT